MYAGVPSLIVSLWEVNDASTSELMQAFYDNLATGMDKAEALRQAKLTYMQEARGLSAHPAYWSPFVQMGDSRPITLQAQQSKASWWIWGAGLVLLLGGGAFWLRRTKRA